MRHIALAICVAIAVAAWIVWPIPNTIDTTYPAYFGAPSPNSPHPGLKPSLAINSLAEGVVRLAAAGDVGTGEAEAFRTASAMDVVDEQTPYDALLLLGDNVYEDGDPALVQERVFEPFGPVLDGNTRLLSVLGNHDVLNSNGPLQAEALGMPARWYSTRIANALIIALDSTQVDNLDQLAWLEQTLRGPRPKWTVVIEHHPAFSGGEHGSDPGVREWFVPMFERYDVDLVLAGHDHDYQRSHEINSVTYIVSGAAARLRETGIEDFTAVATSTFSFVDLAIYADRIEGQAIDQQGQTIDRFVIEGRVS